MKFTIPCLFTLAANAIAGQAAEQSFLYSNSDTVRTNTGVFTAYIEPDFPNTRQFRAIPFAEPPVESRRWLPPKKLPPSDQHSNVTRFPPSCPQFVSANLMFYNSDLTRGNTIYNPNPDGSQNDTSGLVGTATSEDCLYLAIWTPKTEPKRSNDSLPVLFFMTGGGFEIGGIDIPWQMPTSWVERSQSHIVVSINYRLGIFGFPNARGLANGDQNLGILDQRAALEWVRDNIAAFGGDPTRITHMGRSSGAVSADVHAYAYPNDPIAQAYYLQSATVLGANIAQKDPTYPNFTFVAQHFECADPSDGAAELNCMRAISFKDIVNFIGQYTDSGTQPPLRFALSVDDRTVFSDYISRAEAGNLAHIPTMISNTANEAGAGAWQPNITTPPDQSLITAMDVAWFICPTFNATVYRHRHDIPVFRFQHAGQFPNLNVYEWLGAWHASDIPIFFGTYGLLDHVAETTPFEVEVSEAMQDYVLAFVKDPVNGPQREFGWEPMDVGSEDGGDLIRFGSKGVAARHVDGIEVDGVCMGVREYDPFP